MDKVIQWFIHLIRRDMDLFEVDVGEKRKLLNRILQKLKDE